MTIPSLALITLFSLAQAGAPPARHYRPAQGKLARQLHALGCEDGECPDTVDLYGGCHYDGESKKLRFCEFPNGVINPPLRDTISNFLRAVKLPGFTLEDEFVIGFHFTCTQSRGLCDLEPFGNSGLAK